MIFDRFLEMFRLFLCAFSHVSGSLFGGTNAERRTQVARWRGWPAGQLDILIVFRYDFCAFSMSRKPGNPSKGFLEVARFLWTEYEPVGARKDPNQTHLHHFPYHLRSADVPTGW